MNNKPLFSVIIPVYKAEKYLRDCVQSVQNQNCNGFEIIMVDDGSPDTCPQICDELAKHDCRIKVRHGKNEGASTARKHGAEMANGEYLFFLDADDMISSECLFELERQVRQYAPDIICFGMNYENSKQQIKSMPLKYRYGFYLKKDIEAEIFPLLIQNKDATYFAPSLCGKAMKTELFLKNALANSNCTIGEDGACVIPCVFHAHSMVILKECFYYYRYNSNSATKSRKIISWDCPKIIYNHVAEHIDPKAFDFEEQLYRKIVHDTFSVVVSQFHRDDTYRAIVRNIKGNLKDTLYNDAINSCVFSGSIAALIMKFSLKYRLYFLINIYSKYRI